MDRERPGEDPPLEIEDEIRILHDENAAGMLDYAVSVCGSLAAAQDAVQDAFLEYFVARSSRDRIPYPKVWLYRVLRLRLRTAAQLDRADLRVGLDAAAGAAETRRTPNADLGPLWATLAGILAPRELECLKLRAEGLQYADIAEVLGLRPSTVGALLVRAHRKLRKLIPEDMRNESFFVVAADRRNP